MKRIDENHSFNIHVACILNGHVKKAILLKEIYGWIQINEQKGRNIKHGIVWTFMSAEGFSDKFTYMNSKSIDRWLNELEKEGWLYSGRFNKRGYDKTKWYTINHKKYDDAVLGVNHSVPQNEEWISQIEETISQNEESMSQIEEPIPSPTNTPKKTNNHILEEVLRENEKLKKELAAKEEKKDTNEDEESKLPYEKQFYTVMEFLKKTTGRDFRVAKTISAIKRSDKYIKIAARLREGYTLEDFYQVITTMNNKWAGDKKMRDYLQPQTLFSTKFESYLDMAANPIKPSEPKNKLGLTQEEAGEVLRDLYKKYSKNPKVWSDKYTRKAKSDYVEALRMFYFDNPDLKPK